MMRLFYLVITITLSLFVGAALAGSGHDHGHDHGHSHGPVDKSQAEKIATKHIVRLVDSQKIESSWKSVTVSASEKKQFGDKTEWVVSFKNDKAADSAKQTLYVFLTLDGQYLAANFTGK